MGNSADAKIIVGWRFEKQCPDNTETKLAKLAGIVDDSGFYKNNEWAFPENSPEWLAAKSKRDVYWNKRDEYMKSIKAEFIPVGYTIDGGEYCVFGVDVQTNYSYSPEKLDMDAIKNAIDNPLDQSLLEKALAVFKMKDDEDESEEYDEEIVGEYGIWLCASYG